MASFHLSLSASARATTLAAVLALLAPGPLEAQQPSAQVRVPEGAHFVASSQGRVYYWVGCSAWRGLMPRNLVWFEGREEARDRGYRPSRSQGCAGPADPRLLEVEPVPRATDSADAKPIIPPAMHAGTCVLARIVDGDTVACDDGRRIRLLLIDAPEMDQGPFGRVARRVLEELAPVGTRVMLERDVEAFDRYGRTLAYLHLADGRIVNEELLRAGVAVVSVYPPNVQHVDRFRRAVEEAREAGRGLWATEAFECLPADHRAGRCPTSPNTGPRRP